MAKVKRKTPQSSARGRRTPSKPKGGGGLQLPWVPIVAVLGVVGVVALVGYLIWQGGQESSADNSEWAEVEADPAPDLPGDFVDLQTIYDGSYGAHGDNATAPHVSEPVDYSEQGLPPTGGPHWAGPCGDDPDTAPVFCGPVRWGIYRTSWDAESVVHNMEHGGVVVWYNTDDQEVIDSLESVVEDYLNDDELIVMMPYGDMDEDAVAITSWARREIIPVSDYSDDAVRDYIEAHARRFNPESF